MSLPLARPKCKEQPHLPLWAEAFYPAPAVLVATIFANTLFPASLVSNNISRPVCKELNREVAQRHSRGSGYKGTSKYREDGLPFCNKKLIFQLLSLLFFYINPPPTETPLEHFKTPILLCTKIPLFPISM
jgi:hypothetical protein